MHVRTYHSLAIFAELSVQMHAIIPPRASEVHLLSFTEPRLFSLEANVVEEVEVKEVEEEDEKVEKVEEGEDSLQIEEHRIGRQLVKSKEEQLRDKEGDLESYRDGDYTVKCVDGVRYRGLRGIECNSKGQNSGSISVPIPVPFTVPIDGRALSHRQTTIPNSSPTRVRPPHHSHPSYPSQKSAPSTHQSPSLPPSLPPTSTPSLLPPLPSSRPSTPPSSPPTLLPLSLPPSQASLSSKSTPLSQKTVSPTMNGTHQSTMKTNRTADYNTTMWYDEKQKEENKFNSTIFKDSDVTEYFRTLIGCMQGTYVPT